MNQGNITQLLKAYSGGDGSAVNDLIARVEPELRRIAINQLAGERAGHTLQATDVVNEAYLRLIEIKQVQWNDRAHFFAVASRLMRRVLVDHARAKAARKRGGSQRRVTLNTSSGAVGEQLDLLDLDRALQDLEALEPRQVRVVELRYFGGLSLAETAEVLDISTATVKREWAMARAWLFRELSDSV